MIRSSVLLPQVFCRVIRDAGLVLGTWCVLAALPAAAQDAGTPAQVPAQPPAQPSAQARIQSAAQSASSDTVEEVVVRGQRMSEIEFDLPTYVRDFIGQVAALPPGAGHARWRNTVCVGVYNLAERPAQYIADRISALALDVGLKPGEPGCRPEVMIMFTVDADDLAVAMVEENPRLFRPGGPVCCMQLGLDALEDFKHSDAPVRWWHVAMPVDALLGQRAISMPQDGNGNYPVTNVEGPSRIHSGIVDKLYRVVIIVDANQLRGTTWQEIGDYLAVISLAQVNPKADPAAFDSILNLFNNPSAYSGLTDWDRSYVQALYEVNMERRVLLQENQMVSRMVVREEAIEP